MLQAICSEGKMIDGKIHTKETIIQDYKNMVHYYSQKKRKYAASIGFDYQDLVSEGFIGLLKAFEAFDEKKGFRFATIASHYIFGEIRKSYRDRGDTGANYSRQIKEFAYTIRKRELENKSVKEIVKETGFKDYHVFRALDFLINKMPLRFDAAIREDDESGTTLWELYSKPVDETEEVVEDFLESLEKHEEIITRMLVDGEPQRVIAEFLGVTQIRISRTKSKIKEKYLQFKGGE